MALGEKMGSEIRRWWSREWPQPQAGQKMQEAASSVGRKVLEGEKRKKMMKEKKKQKEEEEDKRKKKEKTKTSKLYVFLWCGSV